MLKIFSAGGETVSLMDEEISGMGSQIKFVNPFPDGHYLILINALKIRQGLYSDLFYGVLLSIR